MDFFSSLGAVAGGILGVLAFILLLGILKAMIKVAPPDKLLVVTGRRTVREGKVFGFTVERGRTFVLPYFQALGGLDLGVLPVNVKVEGVNSANGISMGADATACVCIDDDDEAMLYNAVERLMGKDKARIREQVQQTLVGNFRGALNKATPLQAIGMEDDASPEGAASSAVAAAGTRDLGERAQFRAELVEDIDSDLRSFGMKVVSVSLQKIWDGSNYIANLAQKTLAEKRRQVEIEESRLRAIAAQAESDSERRIQVAKSQADERIIASRQALEVYRRESQGSIQEASLTADQSIEEAKNKGEALVQAQLVTLQELKNSSGTVLEASAREEAARIVAAGEREAVSVREGARNGILAKKAALIGEYGDDAASLLFLGQELPGLLAAWKDAQAGSGKLDVIVAMDEDAASVANRGPRAFAEFLATLEEALGIDVRALASPGGAASPSGSARHGAAAAARKGGSI
jgi:flotillin